MEYNVNEVVNHINELGICILEEYFTEEVMKQLDDAAEKEFKYGNVHSEV